MHPPVDTTTAFAPSRSGWSATIGRTLLVQWAVIAALVLVAWLWAGRAGGLSLLSGGAAVAVPNALLALWLGARWRLGARVGMAGLLAGELAKLGATLALLAMVASAFKAQLVWLALIAGVVGALKAQWLAVWFTRDH